MDTLVERCAGLDVHKASVVACVRTPGPDGGRTQRIETFGTTTPDLLALRDWLQAHQITRVGMESTGVYWKPVYYVLEDDFECWLLNAQHMRNVPGRKTDVNDAEWICKLVEHGLVRPSFVPPREIRDLRDLTRYRTALTGERTRAVQRLQKVLEDAQIKLSSVASDVVGVSGRAMIEALVDGTTDPVVLADLAKGSLRRKIPALRAALEGRFRSHHALMCGELLSHFDYLDESIERLSSEIDRLIAPFADAVDLLATIPGVDRRTAEIMAAEMGVDMSQFPSHRHLASWAGLCPGQDESAGKRRSGRTRKAARWLKPALVRSANAAVRSKNSGYLRAHYLKVKRSAGHKKAVVAVAHTMLVAAYHMLDTGQPYHDLGADYFQKRDKQAHVKRLVRQLEGLGHRVVLEDLPQPA